MQQQPEVPLPVKLADGRRRFERWRREHKPYTRLPEPLWSLAADLAREFGLNRVAGLLRLNYYDLKKRLGQPVATPSPMGTTGPSFLELLGTETLPVTECTIECKNATGAQLRIQLKGREWPDLMGICGELWSHRP
jgi:hypothetical protein